MDDADHAKELEMADRELAISAHKERSKEIEPPLEVYGVRICLDCYEEIPEERLRVRPESVRCVSCKEIKEQKEKLRRL